MPRDDYGAPGDPLSTPSLSSWAADIADDLDTIEGRGLTDLPDVEGVPSDGMTLVYKADTGMWSAEYPLSALSVIQADYRWSTDTTAALTPGRVGTDAADPATATLLRLHRLDAQSRDTGPIIEMLDAGAWVNIHDRDTAATVHRFDSAGVPVLTGDVYELPVTVYDSVGTIAANARVSVLMRFTALPGATG